MADGTISGQGPDYNVYSQGFTEEELRTLLEASEIERDRRTRESWERLRRKDSELPHRAPTPNKAKDMESARLMQEEAARMLKETREKEAAVQMARDSVVAAMQMMLDEAHWEYDDCQPTDAYDKDGVVRRRFPVVGNEPVRKQWRFPQDGFTPTVRFTDTRVVICTHESVERTIIYPLKKDLETLQHASTLIRTITNLLNRPAPLTHTKANRRIRLRR